jgi:cell division protein FtsI/penicillin-binding protein 2
MCGKSFSLRSKVLLSFLLAWAAVAAAHVLFYSTLDGEALKAESERFAWREGSIPAIRGRILDRQGVPLAWTELRHDLVLTRTPTSENGREALRKTLAKLPFECAPPEAAGAKPVVLRKNMDFDSVAACEKLLKTHPEFEIRCRVERRTIDYPEIKRLLGRVAPEDRAGKLRGVDGEEREFDKRLAGREGRFKVMLDKEGRWIDGTLKMLSRPAPGEDVRIELSLLELKNGGSLGSL